MGARRSEPGKGDTIGIYVLGPADLSVDGFIGGHGQTAICGSVGEDHSDSSWPVVVKAKSHVTPGQLIQYLKDLTQALEKGFFVRVEESALEGCFISPGLEMHEKSAPFEGDAEEPQPIRLIRVFGGKNARRKAELCATGKGYRAVSLADLPYEVVARFGLDEDFEDSNGDIYEWGVVKE